jgi:hypothetical protein
MSTRSVRISLALCLAASVVGTTSPARTPHAPRKIALIIAIGSYPGGTDQYGPLGSLNDVPMVTRALKQQGFTAITVLPEAQATRTGILAALHDLAAAVQPGDIVAIHDEIDGYDELLVPLGAPNFFGLGHPEYRGDRHIRDDELKDSLRVIRRAADTSGSVLLTVDACFSGSIARVLGDSGRGRPVRGEAIPIGPRGPTRVGPVIGGLSDLDGDSSAGLAPLVVISATREDQLDYEVGKPDGTRGSVGPLSRAFESSMYRMKPGQSYRALYSHMRTLMHAWVPEQDPQIEGADSRALFLGQLTSQTPYFEVSAPAGGSTVVVDGGTLVGVTEQSEVAFYPVGTTSPAGAPLARGTVTGATPFAAIVTPAAGSPPAQTLNGAWMFVTKFVPVTEPVRVALHPSLSARVRQLVQAAVAAAGPGATVVDSAATAEVGPLGGFSDSLSLIVAGTDTAGKVASRAVLGPIRRATVDTAIAIADRLRAVIRTRDLLAMPLRDPALAVDLVFRPALFDQTRSGSCLANTGDPGRARFDGTEWTAYTSPPTGAPAEGYTLMIRNRSPVALWVSVLELTQSMGIQVLFPAFNQHSQTNKLAARDSVEIQACYGFPKKAGRETLMLVATRSPVDFGIIATSANSASRGAFDDLELAMADLYHATRTNPPPIDVTAGTMASVLLRIIPSPTGSTP